MQLAGAPPRLRDLVWIAFFWTFSPVLVFVTFLTVDLDEGLGRALGAAIVASWLVGLAGYGYARLVSSERDERGALTLAAGFGNTGFVGFPLAQLAYGADGSRSPCFTTGSPGSCRRPRSRRRSRACTAAARSRSRRGTGCARAREPAAARVLARARPARGRRRRPGTDAAEHVIGAVIGPYGFFLLGLSLTFTRAPRAPEELPRAAGAVAIRLAGGPLALLATGALLGADVPGVFYLLAGMPSAFHC